MKMLFISRCMAFRIISLHKLLASKEKVLLFILKPITTQSIKIKEAQYNFFSLNWIFEKVKALLLL